MSSELLIRGALLGSASNSAADGGSDPLTPAAGIVAGSWTTEEDALFSETISLYRSITTWTLLAISIDPPSDPTNPLRLAGDWDTAGPRRFATTIVTTSFADVQQLGAYVQHRHGTSAWRCLLDATHLQDEELHAAWVPFHLEGVRELRVSTVGNPAARSRLYDHGIGTAFRLLRAQARRLGYSLRPFNGPSMTEAVVPTDASVERILQSVRVVGWGYTALGAVVIDGSGQVRIQLADLHVHPLERNQAPRLEELRRTSSCE